LADALLFTSIPPKITRRNTAGQDVGPSYQADCIASWVEAGFAPATINARSESLSAEPIRPVTMERGRPVCSEDLQRISTRGKRSTLRRRQRRARLGLDRISQLNVVVLERLALTPASSGVRTPLKMGVQDRLLRLSAAGNCFSATDHSLRRIS
jgi:hypothetical protein